MFQSRRCVQGAMACIVLLAGTLMAQTSLNVTRVGNFGKGEGDVRSAFAQGSLVYYSIGNKVQIASFSNPAAPQKVSSVELSSRIEFMVLTSINSTKYLVVSGGPSVWLINVQAPLTPKITSTIAVGGTCEGVATSGTYAYVAAGEAGFKIYDIATPASPTLAASIDSLAYCESVVISAPYAYIAADEMKGWTGRSFIVDVSTPGAPTIAGRFTGYGGYHQFINVRSGYAYVCDYNAGLQVINVNTPSAPVNVLQMPTGYRTAMIMFDGNYGYIANGELGMRIIDVTNVAAPTDVSLFDTPSRSMAISYGAISIGGILTGHIYDADMTGGMRAINVSNLSAPVGAGVLPVVAGAGGDAYGSFVAGTKAYVAYGSAGLRIIDVANPAVPALLGVIGGMGEARGVAVIGNYAYVAARDSAVRVINVTDPAAPSAVTVVRVPRANGIAASGNYLYVAAGDTGIAVLDATTPEAPVWVTTASGMYGENVAASGNTVGITDYDSIRFYDMTTPATPLAKGRTTPRFTTGNEGFAISGNHAYVPDGDSLRIFDIADLNAPLQVGVISLGGYGYNAAVAGNYAYVAADKTAGLQVVDVANPANPSIAGYYYNGLDLARWVAVDGSYAYVAETASGLTIYNNLLMTGVGETPSGLPGSFGLAQNYPNPFNPSTTVTFTLDRPGFVTLTVHNILGQVVSTLVRGTLTAGEHSVRFDAGSLASGVYFYTLRAGDRHEVRKMMLMK